MNLTKFNNIYFCLTFTWGILANIAGAFVAATFSIIFKVKPVTQYGRWVFIGGKGWGGLSLGNFVFLSKTASNATLNHEIGHSLQNMFFGPLWLFVVGVPSVVRYWYRETSSYKKHPEKHTDYDAIWFEAQATGWGTKYTDACDNNSK